MRPCRSAKSVNILCALVFSAAALLTASAAQAASCSTLKAELRRLETGPAASSSPASQKWSTARRQQQKAISAAERDARYFGCASSGSPNCDGINKKLKSMRANLAAIERQLAKAGGGTQRDSKRIARLRTALDRQNCDAPPASREARRTGGDANDEPRSLLQRLFNPQQQVTPASARTGDREIAAVRSSRSNDRRFSLPAGGTFRTLCVRTCDGYFFPVSFSTGKNQFVNDAARCSEICPAAETELYVYRNPGGDQSQMTSLAGTLYSDQPFAYRYKSEFIKDCSCRATRRSTSRSAWREVSMRSTAKVVFSDISAGIPGHTLQPSRGATFEEETAAPSPLSRDPLLKTHLPPYEDPDTRFNLEEGFDVTADLAIAASVHRTNRVKTLSEDTIENGLPLLSIRAEPQESGGDVASMTPVFKSDDEGFRPAPDQKRPVRVVGPEYFVAQ